MNSRPSKHLGIVRRVLGSYGFPEFAWVHARPTVADLFKPGKRCGIYVLRFSDDCFYVGQAVDVVRRYGQHGRIHQDIQEMSFALVHQRDLNRVEQEIIQRLESRQVLLRNVSLTSIPKGDRDLDLVVTPEAQLEWLADNRPHSIPTRIIDDPALQTRYRHRFDRLLKHWQFNAQMRNFLIEYFRKCVLQPAKTELSFWSITCLTKAFRDSNELALCRVNMFWCDALSVWVNSEGELLCSFRATQSLLRKTPLQSTGIRSLRHHRIDGDAKGGPDQVYLDVQGVGDALRVLQDDELTTAIKTFNLRLMQMGATVYGRYHCIDLANYLLAPSSRAAQHGMQSMARRTQRAAAEA